MLKKIVVAASAISLAVTPAVAQNARTAAAAPTVAAPQPAAEQVDGSELRARGAPFAGAVFVIIVILGVLLAAGVLFDDEDGTLPPVSP
jgi:hypothetical protein